MTKNNTLSSKTSKRHCNKTNNRKTLKNIQKNKKTKNLEPPATSATPQRGLGGTCITKNNTLSSKTSKRQCKNNKKTKRNKNNQKTIEKNKTNKKSGASSHLSHFPEVAGGSRFFVFLFFSMFCVFFCFFLFFFVFTLSF